MTVVIFGLFHGLVYLPVILSWVGPSPYPTNQNLPVDPSMKYGQNSKEGNGYLEVRIDSFIFTFF